MEESIWKQFKNPDLIASNSKFVSKVAHENQIPLGENVKIKQDWKCFHFPTITPEDKTWHYCEVVKNQIVAAHQDLCVHLEERGFRALFAGQTKGHCRVSSHWLFFLPVMTVISFLK